MYSPSQIVREWGEITVAESDRLAYTGSPNWHSDVYTLDMYRHLRI